ncbi:MAG: hypothetical protein KDA61_18725, partial [Planctomycetales bacterium]|nr:hypothetical protein [Planctomycetales bacterium]
QTETDSDGSFVVQTFFDQGTVFKEGMAPGEYDVAISKLEDALPDRQMTRAPKNLLPARYATPNSSELAATVAAGESHEFAFDLTD